MKKILCIGLVLLLFISVPIKGYSAAPVVYGIGEEVILPFLLALLGVQSKDTITSYPDLKDYHDEVYSTLIENLSGLAGMEVIQKWLYNAANGLIQTDSVVWDKLYEWAISQYNVSSGSISTVPSGNSLNLPSFSYTAGSSVTAISSSRPWNAQTLTGDFTKCSAFYRIQNSRTDFVLVGASSTPFSGSSTWINESTGLYVYYKSISTGYSNITDFVFNPVGNDAISYYTQASSSVNKFAYEMIYGGYDAVANDAVMSDAYDQVISSSAKQNIIDGSNVIQLYNPAALQNGLEIIPGGDPEEDPNLKKIPFAVTADWWNFFQQFGEQSGNTYVNAYNALNGIGENVTTGLISKAYDALGIASISGSAANAAQGIISLTDNNIYPASQTAADAITNTIPSSLTPEAPDSGIDNESDQGLYKLPDLRDYFPFCIPFDLIDFLSCFAAEPETPHFIIALSDGEHLAQENIDLEVFNDIAAMVRTFELAIFVVGLILITRNLIRG